MLSSDELADRSREHISALRPVWQTSPVNLDFAEHERSCGGRGFRVDEAHQLEPVLAEAVAVIEVPSLVAVRTSPRWT